MNCPKCDSRMFCVDSRPLDSKNVTRRRYNCHFCKEKLTTYELPCANDGNSTWSRFEDAVSTIAQVRVDGETRKAIEFAIDTLKNSPLMTK